MVVRDILKLKNLLNYFFFGIFLNSFICKKYFFMVNVWVVVFVGIFLRYDVCFFYYFVIVFECLWFLVDLDVVVK